MLDTRERFQEHVDEALFIEKPSTIVYGALQGSQNYNLQYEDSDVDTKFVLVPTLDQIVRGTKMKSYTHVRKNDEHIDFKVVPRMFDCFRKQNMNFIEILFTDYWFCNPYFKEEVYNLRAHAEEFARMDTYAAVKCMKGMAFEKHHALEHRYPAKIEIIDKYGYDGKQLSHMVRIHEFLERFIKGDESYKDCMQTKRREELIALKCHTLPLDAARERAAMELMQIVEMVDEFCEKYNREEYKDQSAFDLLYDIQYEIMRKGLKQEILQER